MADPKRPISERARQQPDRDDTEYGVPPLATDPPLSVEEMAKQQPDRSTTQGQSQRAPSDRTTDKLTERHKPGAHFATVPGAAKED